VSGVARSKKRFKDYSPAQQRGIAALTVLSVAIVATAERDIQRRPAEEVRGSKLLWRLLSLNALGAVGYLRWARRAAITQ
jgi:hypothetical protein